MAQKKPLISIGIPFFNAEKYLALAIKSVLYQTYTHWELILLDDGSSDHSLNIAKAYEAKDTRIKVINDGKNLGLPQRLNELSDLANGKYYARMDADDMMFPNRLEKQVQYLIANPKVDLVGSGLIAIDNNNQIIGIRKGQANLHVSLNDIFSSTWAVHPTIMGKSKWFKYNKYDISLKRAQDYDLWLRTVEKSYFSKLHEPYLYYREASTSTIKKYFIAMMHSMKIYWKNVEILGFLNSLKMTFTSLLKLTVYILFWALGKTSILIERRSQDLKIDELNYHQKVINKMTSKDLLNQPYN